jgi:hypothetical protein
MLLLQKTTIPNAIRSPVNSFTGRLGCVPFDLLEGPHCPQCLIEPHHRFCAYSAKIRFLPQRHLDKIRLSSSFGSVASHNSFSAHKTHLLSRTKTRDLDQRCSHKQNLSNSLLTLSTKTEKTEYVLHLPRQRSQTASTTFECFLRICIIYTLIEYVFNHDLQW